MEHNALISMYKYAHNFYNITVHIMTLCNGFKKHSIKLFDADLHVPERQGSWHQRSSHALSSGHSGSVRHSPARQPVRPLPTVPAGQLQDPPSHTAPGPHGLGSHGSGRSTQRRSLLQMKSPRYRQSGSTSHSGPQPVIVSGWGTRPGRHCNTALS